MVINSTMPFLFGLRLLGFHRLKLKTEIRKLECERTFAAMLNFGKATALALEIRSSLRKEWSGSESTFHSCLVSRSPPRKFIGYGYRAGSSPLPAGKSFWLSCRLCVL